MNHVRLLVCPLLLCVIAGPVAADSQLPKIAAMLEAGEPVKIVCIGDSITGVYYHTGGWRAYPEMLEIALKRAYPKAKVKVINAGISGNSMPQGLKRLDNDVLKHEPHLVTIMYGMNDLTRDSLDTFKKNLTDMISRCRAKGAEVMLCTQNNVITGRDPKKLAEFSQGILDLGRELKVPVADCYKAYEAAKRRDATEWSLLLSDPFHPNMDGHKLFASILAKVITGKEDTLQDVGPPTPAIPRTLALVKAGKPIRVLAMPPYDKIIGPALQEVAPSAKVEVTSWPVEGQSLAKLEQAANKMVRKMKPDLVIVAVPVDAEAASTEQFIRSFSWVLSWSLSFGYQEWDVIAIPPSTAQPKLAGKDQERDALMRRLIRAQDLSMVTRSANDTGSLQAVLVRWLKTQILSPR